ncbi:triose-phosphate isomerase [Xanthovirga aplysinae]|uniref:triose-phosphate isomerase n=1 Tax=Xanthovirga aplysinae TaxID=2529853 RepID=UPI0012BCDDF0|nr:triose-phosphate isomerase [Xanthovirga aplysinae]MTI30842.1 triose-phosphate isomerase [Xanthovirga aplysinae]
MREKIVAGNWKMNNTMEEGLKLTSEVVHMVEDESINQVKVILATPFIHLSNVSKLIQGVDNVYLAAQNCNEHKSGAYTGEISAAMLKSIGAEFVILGHSERREYFNESNQLLKERTDTVLNEGLRPIFCCGESLEIREAETHESFVCQQLTESLFHLDADSFSKVVIAYEPIWAIGTGKTASSEQAQEMHAAIRTHIAQKYGQEVANEIVILYGGSCKPSNASEIFAGKDVDGGLIGGASLKSRDFVDIIKSF